MGGGWGWGGLGWGGWGGLGFRVYTGRRAPRCVVGGRGGCGFQPTPGHPTQWLCGDALHPHLYLSKISVDNSMKQENHYILLIRCHLRTFTALSSGAGGLYVAFVLLAQNVNAIQFLWCCMVDLLQMCL